MTFFTKIRLNPARRQARKLLSDTQSMHAAVLATLPPGAGQESEGSRVLWRVDERQHEHVLYMVSPEKPTSAVLVEQAGWDTLPAQSADYSRLLGKLMRGQRWRFELVANPTYSEFRRGERGKVRAHVSAQHQLGWLYDRSITAGFALAPRIDDDDVSDEERARWSEFDAPQVVGRWTDVFHRNKSARRGRPVRIAKSRFVGTLEVTDPDAFRRTLTQGIGRARGYGCGLMTIASL